LQNVEQLGKMAGSRAIVVRHWQSGLDLRFSFFIFHSAIFILQ